MRKTQTFKCFEAGDCANGRQEMAGVFKLPVAVFLMSTHNVTLRLVLNRASSRENNRPTEEVKVGFFCDIQGPVVRRGQRGDPKTPPCARKQYQ